MLALMPIVPVVKPVERLVTCWLRRGGVVCGQQPVLRGEASKEGGAAPPSVLPPMILGESAAPQLGIHDQLTGYDLVQKVWQER